MKLASAFLMALTLATVCAFAQTDPPNASAPNNGPATDQTAPSGSADQTQNAPAQPSSPDASSPDAKSTTIRGCLEAGSDHNYTVTDKNGIRYTLTAMDANALSSHVGEEVEADGEPAAGSDAAAGEGPATDKPAASPSQTFKVNGDLRKVSDKCAK
jgi:hypothetical protein